MYSLHTQISYYIPSFLINFMSLLLLYVRITGLSVWPASILLGQWVAQLAAQQKVDYSDKVVLELGAGCGLPVIVAGMLLYSFFCYYY